QIRLDRGVDRQDSVLVFDQVPEIGVALFANRCFERERFLGDLQRLPYLFERHMELLGKLLRRRLATYLVEHMPTRTHDLVDHLNHVNGHTNGARLIRERTADGLSNPPSSVGRELEATSIFELVDCLHQADVAFLDQVEELQAPVDVFLGDRDDEAQVRLYHLLLCLARLTLAFLHHVHNLAKFADLKAGLARQRMNLCTQLFDAVLVAGDKILPAVGREFRYAVEPERIELGAEIVLEKVLAHDAVALGKPQQASLANDEPLVDVIELLDQRLDARPI